MEKDGSAMRKIYGEVLEKERLGSIYDLDETEFSVAERLSEEKGISLERACKAVWLYRYEGIPCDAVERHEHLRRRRRGRDDKISGGNELDSPGTV